MTDSVENPADTGTCPETGAVMHRGTRPMTITFKDKSSTRLTCRVGIATRVTKAFTMDRT